MSASPATNKLDVGSISDRGLNEKRPLNEDSCLADVERGIFVVADGVGGADAGEVASQTAVDVLNEAFRHKISNGDDIEDLMELAIQRANSSIHQMAAENPRFSMMATTVVALHLNGNSATIGHVGDSRLYLLSPDGMLHRETEDHSIVEEEVRAGRMTPEQAANHPSKNVISRALGAEDTVEADMKTMEVEDGSAFLLCTDGITRHIPDDELRNLLMTNARPLELCEEMKRRCYQRGAEDNLTAVIVRVGAPKFEMHDLDEERTVSHERLEPVLAAAASVGEPSVEAGIGLTPASRIAFPGAAPADELIARPSTAQKSGVGRSIARFFLFLLVLAVVAAAFYGGLIYQRQRQVSSNNVVAQPSPTPLETAFSTRRDALDANPSKWMADDLPALMAKEAIAKPTDSKDPEFLYLYGRALMATGNHKDAAQAFELALSNLRSDNKAPLPLQVELKLANAAAALKASKNSALPRSQEASMAEDKAITALDEVLALKSPSPPK